MLPQYGNWKVVRRIGRGSFGTVYEIEQEDALGFSTRSALKVMRIPQSEEAIEELRSEGENEERVAEYFYEMTQDVMEEVRLMYELKGHANIVTYLDHEIRLCEDGISREILVRMELLQPLRQYMKEHRISKRNIIQLGIDICKALERCQQYHIIHRDIKPGNILVTETGEYKLSDFGIARRISQEGSAGSMSQKGTYSYMAPEVYMGRHYDYRVDLYSLGIVMYQLLNDNRDPFLPVYPDKISLSNRKEALSRRMNGEKLPFPSHDKESLAEIILKACSYDPGKRYHSPYEMRAALEKTLSVYLPPDSMEHMRDIQEQDSELEIPFSENRNSYTSTETDERLKKAEQKIINRQTAENGKEEKTHRMLPEGLGEDQTRSIQPDLDLDQTRWLSSEVPDTHQTIAESGKEKKSLTRLWKNRFLVRKVCIIGILLVVLSMAGISGYRYMISTVIVPDVSNTNQADAEATLKKVSLSLKQIKWENSNEIEKGKVIAVEKQGKRIKKNSSLVLIISLGDKIVIPSLLGESEKDASDKMKKLGLNVHINTAYSSDYAEGKVMSQNLQPDTNVNEGEELILTISLGKKPVQLSDYTGQDAEKIKAVLEKSGIKVTLKKEYSTKIEKGGVIQQSVKKGKNLYEGDAMTLTVSKGIEQVKVPSLIGLTKSKADSILKEAGLKLSDVERVYNLAEYGSIIWQSRNSGSNIDKGSSIAVKISLGERPKETISSQTGSGKNTGSAKKKASESASSRPAQKPKPTQSAEKDIDDGEADVIN